MKTEMFTVYGTTDIPIPWEIGQASSINEIISLIGYYCFDVITVVEN